MSDALYYTIYPSHIGNLLLVASTRGLRFVTLLGPEEFVADRLAQQFGSIQITELPGFFTKATTAIDQYFEHGTRLELPVDLVGGTPLQRMVWFEIARIPYGETISYTALAERIGFPRAVRAVASACGANPVPLAIACHRVVAKDGTLGGFSLGGAGIKDVLLRTESRLERAVA